MRGAARITVERVPIGPLYVLWRSNSSNLAIPEREALQRVVSFGGGVAGREAPGAVLEQEPDEGAVGVMSTVRDRSEYP